MTERTPQQESSAEERLMELERKVYKLATAVAIANADIVVLRSEIVARDNRLDVLEDHVKSLEDDRK